MISKPPQFLADLYRDFRDRHLLIPAGLLVAALIAVPVLLSESPASPPPAPETHEIEATAATPAVLAEEAGVRNYRKRLKELTRKNPFDQQFTGPTGELLDLALGDAGGDLDIGGTGGSSGSDLGVDIAGGPSGGGGGVQPADGEPAPGRGPSGSGDAPAPAEERWFTWEVDLAFGPVREAERFEGVRSMEFLPSRRNAVAVMAGVGLRGNRAGFMFLPDVTASRGEGRCSPGPQNCVFLMLKKGEQHRVTVIASNGDEVTYRLEVLDIVRAEFAPGELGSGGDE